MNTYQKIGTICLIGAAAGLALGLLLNPWFLALGAALAGASAALEIVSDSVSSHKVKVIDAGKAQEEQWYKDQQYDFMLK